MKYAVCGSRFGMVTTPFYGCVQKAKFSHSWQWVVFVINYLPVLLSQWSNKEKLPFSTLLAFSSLVFQAHAHANRSKTDHQMCSGQKSMLWMSGILILNPCFQSTVLIVAESVVVCLPPTLGFRAACSATIKDEQTWTSMDYLSSLNHGSRDDGFLNVPLHSSPCSYVSILFCEGWPSPCPWLHTTVMCIVRNSGFPANLENEFHFFQSEKSWGIWEKCLKSGKSPGIWFNCLKDACVVSLFSLQQKFTTTSKGLSN